MSHIYHFSSDDRKDRGLTLKAAAYSPTQVGHLRYAKSAVDFWEGKGDTVRIKRVYRKMVAA